MTPAELDRMKQMTDSERLRLAAELLDRGEGDHARILIDVVRNSILRHQVQRGPQHG
jgi:hypothetical protein